MFGPTFERDAFAAALASKLRILRACAEISQDETAHAVGISRQTYFAYESGKRPIPWDKCLALLFYFEQIPETRLLLHALQLAPQHHGLQAVEDTAYSAPAVAFG